MFSALPLQTAFAANMTFTTNTTITTNQTIGPGSTWTINPGVTLTINPGVSILVQVGGTISNSGTIEISRGIDGSRGIITNSAGTIVNNSGGTIINNGIINNFSSGNIYNSGGTITNLYQINNLWHINNSGTINNSGGINNSNSGGIISITNSGTIVNNSGSVIYITNSGAITNNSGGTIINFGGISNQGIITNSGAITNNSSGNIYNQGITNNSGTINNSGIIDNGGSYNYNTINNSGTIVNNSGGIINNNSGGNNNNNINNSGTITNNGIINNFSGNITNNSSGNITNNSSGTINNSGGTIINSGIINNQCDAVYSGTAPTGNPINYIQCADTTSPIITTPTNQITEATSSSGAVVTYPPATATDNVGVTSGPTCTPSSGSTFSIGTTTVTCTATDSSGNTSTKSFDVIVQDTTNPEVIFVSLTPSIVGDSSQVTITKIASDLIGVDSITAQIKGPSPSTDIIGTVTLSLNSGTIQSGTWSGAFTFPSKDIVPDGTYTIDEIVTDASGNSLSMNDGIITLDRTAPTLSVISLTPSFLRPTDLATITASTSDALSGISSVTTQDSTLGSLQISLALISGSTDPGQVGTFQGFITGALPEGLHDVIVSTKDNAVTPNENSITVNNAFTIDATSPTLTLPSDIILEATSSSGAIVQYTVSTSDNIDTDIPVICDVSSDTLLPFGNTLITCSASDDAGNTSTDSFNVTVVDTTVPTLNMPSDITAEAISATGSYVQYSATAIDIVDGNLIPTCTPSSDSIFPLGLTMVTCSVTDAAGNTGTSSFSVTIQDTTAPLLTIPSNLTLEAPSLTTPANTGIATATDAVDSAPLVTYSDSTAPGTGQILSVITRTWTATDSLGNSASADQIITIQDTTAPIITAPNDITIISTISVSPLLGTPTVSDNFDSSPIVTNDAPASFAPETTTTITWTATDHTGNSQSSTQQVIVNTPGQATNDITTLANSFGANTSVLENASSLLNDNNPNNDNGACGKLDAFINKINSDNSLSSAEKTQLILAANAIKTSLGC